MLHLSLPEGAEGPRPELRLADAILHELGRAREKFPGKNVTFAALVEEVGELATAIFEEDAAHVRKEAVQVAVMAMRIVLDGDHCYEPWRAAKGLDPLSPEARSLGQAVPSPEPFFIAETGNPKHLSSAANQMAWREQRLAEARAHSATGHIWPRITLVAKATANGKLITKGILIEVWDEKPADEGPKRWTLDLEG